MEIITKIAVRKVFQSGIREVDFENLEFGKFIADHMLIADYADGEWNIPNIVPYADITLSPATLALHYGQTVFEGMKAFRMSDGRINIFRIEKHHERFNRSLQRMCMPAVPEELFVDGMRQLVQLDKDWVPGKAGSALYIRPFMYASEAKMGVQVSNSYRFLIFTGPVPALYNRPIRVKVETEYIRAARGGTGFAKCGGNYGGAFYPTQKAKDQGYDQVLWTRGEDNRFIEESGMMNAMFVIDGTLVTAPLSDTILDGVTRDSLLTLARDLGIPTEERPVSVDELRKAFINRNITEAFGAGTAAVVAPIQTIGIEGIDYHLPVYNDKNVLNILKDNLERIRKGQQEDIHNWNYFF